MTCILACSKKTIRDNSWVSVEQFTDSLKSGEKSKTKVIIQNFRSLEGKSNRVLLKFYNLKIRNSSVAKTTISNWVETDGFNFAKDGITGINPEVSDFNNDGFNDFTYQSGAAGRGGNEIRKLFIYNPKTKKYFYIKNSENFPNLSYNSKLNCINSFILTGSTTTVFLKIQKDSLYDFAKVDVTDKILVRERDSSGNFKILEEKKFVGNDDDFYSGYSNYIPLEK